MSEQILRQDLLSVIEASVRSVPGERIDTDCLVPRVVSVRLAENTALLATAWMVPPEARPETDPVTLRDVSLQEPEIVSPW